MMNLNFKNIETIEDSDVELYRNLQFTPKSHTDANVFVAEGKKTVRKLLKSNIEIVSLITIDKYFDEISGYSDRISNSKLLTAPKELLDNIAGFKLHEGIMAIGRIPKQLAIDSLSDRIIVLCSMVNSENVGAIIRNALAFGFDSIVYDNSTSSPYLRRAVRVSMGSIFFEKIYKSEDLTLDLKSFQSKGYEIVSIELTDEAIDINAAELSQKVCLLFGAESNGISNEYLKLSDKVVKVPIAEQAESLNVAACSAIVLNHYANNLARSIK